MRKNTSSVNQSKSPTNQAMPPIASLNESIPVSQIVSHPFFSPDEMAEACRGAKTCQKAQDTKTSKALPHPPIPNPSHSNVDFRKPPILLARFDRDLFNPSGEKALAPGIDDYFYRPAEYFGPEKSMRVFMDDKSIDAEYKKDMCMRYPFLKKSMAEP